MDELKQLRVEINSINQQMQHLFEKRMELCRQVALYKQAHQMEIFVPEREIEILESIQKSAAEGMADYERDFFNCLLNLSRQYQTKIIFPDGLAAAPIQTDRLQLAPMKMDAVPAVFALTSNPEVAKYMRFDVHTNPEQTRTLIEEWCTHPNRAYLVLKMDGEFLGVLVFKPRKEYRTSIDLTLFLNPSCWNQGYATELTETAKKIAPSLLHAKSLHAYVVSSNVASCKVLEKAGFQLESERTFPDYPDILRIYQYIL